MVEEEGKNFAIGHKQLLSLARVILENRKILVLGKKKKI
jgi:ABC-type multidrug transport system fused ATPase/permease subunit